MLRARHTRLIRSIGAAGSSYERHRTATGVFLAVFLFFQSLDEFPKYLMSLGWEVSYFTRYGSRSSDRTKRSAAETYRGSHRVGTVNSSQEFISFLGSEVGGRRYV